MRCDQFQQRLDWLLDQRRNVRQDDSLCRHSEKCDVCRERLEIWDQIDVFVSPDPLAVSRLEESRPVSRQTKSRVKMRLMQSALAVGAAILLFVSLNPLRQNPLGPVGQPESQKIASTLEIPPEPEALRELSRIESESPDQNPPVTVEPAGQLVWQSSRWWTAVSDDQWVSQTIPAVTSVRLGVAPIGRSMKRALSILMIQTNSTPLSPSAGAPDGGPDQFQEQTSNGPLSGRITGLV